VSPAAFRPVQPDLRVLSDHRGRPAPPRGRIAEVDVAAAQGSLTACPQTRAPAPASRRRRGRLRRWPWA